ncbi:SsrA-binding protein, partial [Candidatus Microgenomates bacterium]|nr:SsrA-binding protein [Candidatus Microgenomates bacterium]
MKIVNRQAYHKYQILDRFEAGIKLTGPEVKSIRGGRIKLERAFVKIAGSEGYLANAHVPPYPYARQPGYDPNRSRKLLLHKKEIISLKSKIEQKNLT